MAMKNFEKQLSEGLRTHEQPNVEQVQRTVVAVQNMAAKHPPRNHRSWISFLIIQARFSGVSMWLWQILVLAALLGCMYSGALSAYPYVSLMGCSVAAITAVLPILYRTIRYQMMEIELPCYYSGAADFYRNRRGSDTKRCDCMCRAPYMVQLGLHCYVCTLSCSAYHVR